MVFNYANLLATIVTTIWGFLNLCDSLMRHKKFFLILYSLMRHKYKICLVVATYFDVALSLYFLIRLWSRNNPKNKKVTPPPSKPPSLGAWPFSYKTFDLTPLSWCLTLCNENITPKTKKVTPLPSKPPSLGAWPFSYKTFDLTP